MSDFFKKFLLEDPRRFAPSGRFVALAAFGKHPGWDDHVEDLGLETESLNFAKTLLYVNGIGGQIDSGAWEKLDAAQQLASFKHVFLWQRSGQILVGRMWSSSDGKGRKRYPMVVCFHFMGVTLGWALKHALPALAELEEGCLKTTSAADVRALLNLKRAALREAIQSTDGKGEYAPVLPEALHKILLPANSEGFLRILYQIQSQLAGFGPGIFGVRTAPASARAQQVRVPVAAQNPESALLFWTRFFLVYIDGSVPLLLTLPLEADWVDVTAGEPESHEMFCLRATPKAVPMVSEVPYTLDTEFRSNAASFLQSFQRGETRRIELKSAPAPVADPGSPAKGGWLKWLGVGAVVVAAVAAVMLFFGQSPDRHSGGPATITQRASPPGTTEVARAETQGAKLKMDGQAEADRLAEEKKRAEALAAAAKLKADNEAAAKAKEREIAEAAAREKERLAAEAAAKERQLAETAAKEKEREMAAAAEQARQQAAVEAARLAEQQAAKDLLERQRKEADAVAAGKKDPELSQTKAQAVSVPSGNAPATNAAETKPASAAPAPAVGGASGEMTNSIGMILVAIPSGIWVGKYEVTQAEYKRVMGTNPSKFVDDRQPVEKVNWNEAVEFNRKLTQMERATLPAGKVYSLPTENQWTEFSGGQKFEDLHLASSLAPAVVGQSGPPNKFGLYDVLGNVWEWCLDDRPGDTKLLKGGSYDGKPYYNRQLSPETPSVSCGFRCVLVPQ